MNSELKDNKQYIERAKQSIKNQLSVDDLIKRQLDLFESIDKAENILFKANYDLLFLYFPEAANMVKERAEFIDLMKKTRSLSYNEIANILKISEKSMGYDIGPEGISTLKSMTDQIIRIEDLKKGIEENMEKLLKKDYPNTLAITNTLLLARLIRFGGSAKKLSMMPASKIQVLGAEKELFSKKKKPKYGVIFSHPLIQESDDPGKAAKILSSIISIAARTDTISKAEKSDELKRRLTEKIKRLNHGNK